MKQKRILMSVVCTVLVSAALATAFGAMYVNDRAWGAWGDDSAGYIYLAGRLFSGLPLIYHDDLGAMGLEFFGDERLARWLIPTHHQFINPEGTVASKYPVGLSLLMVKAAWLVGDSEGFYLVNPLMSTLNVVLTFLLAIFAFASYRWRYVVGILAAVGLGLSNLYYDHALAQPMREIPSITFLLLTAICVMLLSRVWGRNRNRAILLTVLAGLSYGMAINIRETSIVVLPAIAVFVWLSVRMRDWKTQLRALLPYASLFIATMLIALTPTIYNSYSISKEKVVFKPRDTTRVVLLSNIGHVSTLSIDNVFDNQGKFRPGTGALPHFWKSIQHASPMHFFVPLCVLGLLFLWRESKSKALFFLLWIAAILGLFSLWINPYSRYILPLFPPVMLLGAYGLARTITEGLPGVWKHPMAGRAAGIIMLAITVLAYQPLVVQAKENLLHTDVHMFKAISQEDLNALEQMALSASGADKPVVMFSGDWQFGTSETFEAHTHIKTIRFPLEQRFIFDNTEVQTFFDQMLNEGYDLFVWIDETSSLEAVNWLTQYQTTQVFTHDFSFQPAVRVYQIHPK